MTVDQRKRSSEDDSKDRFPVGMRVLAVDDDPTCLKVLETLLHRCKYHVTSTNEAVAALKMLRENKNNFDIVISDVRMPDMDGFKFLELVGLEMDLPVIMLSAFGDTELVMQGVSHGACDYLLKPVRIEELRNIWQHVLRKKKGKTKEHEKEVSMQTMANRRIDQEGAHGAPPSDNAYQNRKSNRKRKDHDEDEDEDGEDEDDNESEETSNQKKSRVVWSIELHQKFVGAVNQLGIDKAVPKKILDLMNVEGLTRENVASHLQKYRLYLKKALNGENQQANSAHFWKDSSYMHMASLEGHRDFRTPTAVPGRLSSTGLSSYFSGGVLSRFNTPSGLLQNSNNAISTSFGKLQQPAVVFPSIIQNSNLLQGIPSTLGTSTTGRLQQNKFVSSPLIANSNSLAAPSSYFLPSSSFPNSRTNVDNPYNVFNNNNNPLLRGNSSQNTGGFGIQSSLSLNHQEPFKMDHPIGSSNFLDHNRYNGGFVNQTSVPLNPGPIVSSNMLDHGRTDGSWNNPAMSSKLPPSSLPISQPFHQDALTYNNSLKDRNFPSDSKTPFNPIDFTSNYSISAPMGNVRADIQNQVGLIDNGVQNQKFGSLKQTWESNKLGSLHSINDSNRNMDMPTAGKFNASPTSPQHEGGDNISVLDPKMKTGGGYLHHLQQDGDFAEVGFDSLDDLMSPMVKREHEAMLLDGDFGIDGYSLGSSCI